MNEKFIFILFLIKIQEIEDIYKEKYDASEEGKKQQILTTLDTWQEEERKEAIDNKDKRGYGLIAQLMNKNQNN